MSEFNEDQEIKVEKVNKKPNHFILYCLATVLLCAVCCYSTAKIVLEKNQTSVIINQQQGTNSLYAEYSDITDLTKVVPEVQPSIVEVYTESTTFGSFFGSYITSGAGSGIVFSSDGYIVTNNHVVENATSIRVKDYLGTEYDATLIGADPVEDIAVIKIEANNMKAVTVGTSNDLLVGQKCFAVGNPLGTLGGTVTDGIISALSRNIIVEGNEMCLLQTNTAINHGNSGGGLFNINGNLIAIVNCKNASESVEGIGFAIPIDDALPVITQLISQGYVTGRSAIGIECISIDSIQKAWSYGFNSFGVYVENVTSQQAKNGGLQKGDLIVAINESAIGSLTDLQRELLKYEAGSKVTLTVFRKSSKLALEIELIQKK